MVPGGELRPAAPLYVFGQQAHGFLRDFDAIATVDRGLGNIDGSKDSVRRRSRST
jgi:hypothetical protein